MDYGEDSHKETFPQSISPYDPENLGSTCNLLIEWETGEITWEPLTNIMTDVKHCGIFKARSVADGHLTKKPTETVYSGAVALRNLRLAMFHAECDHLQLWGADGRNAYLQALTKR